MGYGQNLKDILDNKGMTVKELALKAKIAPTTLYSIIQRDTAIRFDTALRISNILDIPISSICKDNPYDDIETLPTLPSDNEKWNINSHKNAYISDRTAHILKKFDYTELPMVDELIADLYVLDDITRRDLFEYAKMLKKNHISPERAADLKDIKQRNSARIKYRSHFVATLVLQSGFPRKKAFGEIPESLDFTE